MRELDPVMNNLRCNLCQVIYEQFPSSGCTVCGTMTATVVSVEFADEFAAECVPDEPVVVLSSSAFGRFRR